MTTVIEVNAESCSISVSKGFLLVKSGETEEKIPVSDLEALVLNSRGVCITGQALARLGGQGIPVVHAGANSMPCAVTLPYGDNVYRRERVLRQIACSLPLKKNLWRIVVSAKIANQARVLELTGNKHHDLDQLSTKVLSGDSGNAEAIAARFYWERLFGSWFRRNPDLPGVNGFLNYGYAILRAAMCRGLVASGLIPELGIHHHNQMNPFCLADDLMEPFRPYVDLLIFCLALTPDAELLPAHKRALVSLLDLPLENEGVSTHLRYCLQRAVEQFLKCLETKKPELVFPLIGELTLMKIKGGLA